MFLPVAKTLLPFLKAERITDATVVVFPVPLKNQPLFQIGCTIIIQKTRNTWRAMDDSNWMAYFQIR